MTVHRTSRSLKCWSIVGLAVSSIGLHGSHAHAQSLPQGDTVASEKASLNGSGPVLERSAVRGRRFQSAKRFELGVDVGFLVLPRLVDVVNFTLSAAYNPLEWLGIELRGGYAYSASSNLARDVQAKFVASNEPRATDLSDNWALKVNAVLGARFQPIYGKVNLLSEWPVHFQFYAWAGAGVGTLEKTSIVLCLDRQAGSCGSFVKSNRVAPLVGTAIGSRFWLPTSSDRHSFKLEVRGLSFVDSYVADATRSAVSADNANGDGILKSGPLTHLLQLDIGYAFSF